MSFEGRNYFANHQVAPQILQGTPMYNVEVSEGNNPPGDFYPASYLPVVQSENRIGGSNFVLMPGKVVSLDTNKRLIPAGLAWDKKNYDTAYAAAVGDAATKKAAGTAATTMLYDAADVAAGVIKADNGTYAVEGDSVASGMADANVGVTNAIGIMRYSALQAPGPDPSDPSTFYKHAYDTGGARAFSRWCYIQVPVVEVNQREEAIPAGAPTYRIQLYTDGTPLAFYKAGVLVGSITAKANPSMFTEQVTGDPTQFAVVGRTILFNGVVPAGYTVRYQPKVDLPFTCLKATYGNGVIGKDFTEKGMKDYLGQYVSYNMDSNFQVLGTDGAFTRKIGEILDFKEGSSKDLALVRTYFRDFGLWQEAPGSATDGRNAYLAIANAPRYIARIAVNFNTFNA